jgi:hypothetical protein
LLLKELQTERKSSPAPKDRAFYEKWMKEYRYQRFWYPTGFEKW